MPHAETPMSQVWRPRPMSLQMACDRHVSPVGARNLAHVGARESSLAQGRAKMGGRFAPGRAMNGTSRARLCRLAQCVGRAKSRKKSACARSRKELACKGLGRPSTREIRYQKSA